MTTMIESAVEPTVAASGPLGDHGTFQAQLASLGLPEAWSRWKRENWESLQSMTLPRHRDEKWRFAARLDFDPLAFRLGDGLSEPDAAALVDRSGLVARRTARLVFGNNEVAGAEAVPEELAARGVVFQPLVEALHSSPELLGDFLFKSATDLGSAYFHALHNAYFGGGYVLHVPDNVEIEDPFVAFHWLDGANAAIFPHTLVIAGRNSRFSIVDVQVSTDPSSPGFACSVNNLFAADGARVFRKTIQDFNEATVSLQLDTNNAGRDTTVRSINLNLGSRRSRFENEVRITGPGADVKLYSLTVAHGEQEFDQRTLQVHDAPHAVSDLLYKNALLDRSRTIFSGLIKVSPVAQQTDAYQTNRNLLLDPGAEANSLPGLEIEANDVKCSHGATTGQLDPEELFYFAQRGIPRKVAQRLMIFGFFEEVIQQFENDELEENLRALIERKFAGA